MTPTKKTKRRGRPRKFDPDQALSVAQQLFHARGYDGVTVSDMTDALGINPPSFYAAFGNKLGLFTLALDRYAAEGAIPLSDLLHDDRPVADGLAAVLQEAARRYAADSEATGCLVLEGTRCSDPEAQAAARAFYTAAQDVIHRFIAARHPEAADVVTDFVGTTMAGMSAQARNGHDLKRLLASAEVASVALRETLAT